ncbi:dual oxidase maturation factor 1 isoform X2 [Cherax quadricarinatus]|uniref:dual oxidase maturation factor 1 isoform X2 n=1 Tax=Cherax quadricarinatus TaxID=27406 RepID=UPI00387EE550
MSVETTSPGWFDAFRWRPFPTLYTELKTPVTEDILYVGWLVAFLIVFIPFVFFIIPTIGGGKHKFSVFLRVTLSLTLGLIIMVCNFGQEWEVGHLDTHTLYRAGTGQEISARVGVKLGLRSVNITLKALEEPRGDLQGEVINYNERFSWEWGQGRAGFGPFAGEIQRSFRAAQYRGTPLPILWVAEYFTFDGEGIRFGRYYRTSGWYSHICIWTAFPLWILTVILFKLTISYAAQMLALTGSMLTCAALIWAGNRNFIELEVPFSPPNGILRTVYGVHWYLALIVGILCMILGAVLFVLDYRYHNELSEFFGNNPLMIVEQETLEEMEEPTASNEMEMENMNQAGLSKGRVVTLLRGRGTTKKYNKKVNYPSYSNKAFSPSTPLRNRHLVPDYQGEAQSYDQNASAQNYDQNASAQSYDQNASAQNYDQNASAQSYDQNASAHSYGQHLQANTYPQPYQQEYPQPYQQEYQQEYPQPYQQGHQQPYQQDYSDQGYGPPSYPAPGYQEDDEDGIYMNTADPNAPPRPPKPGGHH